MECWHMSGAGNDFMVIDARNQKQDFSVLAKDLCKKTGADGFMAVDNSESCDFKLHFYNSDGSRGEMCGNGSRCICRFAYDNGIAGETMVIETDAGPVPGQRLSENRYVVKLNNPGVLDVDRPRGVTYLELGSPGLPHAVIEHPDLRFEDRDALREKAISLRYCPLYPKGANVDFYCRTGKNQVRILTYERGVEDYTLACGTGCGCVAAALWQQGKLPEGNLTLENPGGILEVRIQESKGKISDLFLEGPAEILKIYDFPPFRL